VTLCVVGHVVPDVSEDRYASIFRVESKINAYSPNDTASHPGTLLSELVSRTIMVIDDRKLSCHLKITKFFEVAVNRRYYRTGKFPGYR